MNHAELERELPWYLNATVSPAVRDQIERALPGCASCATELGELRALREALVDIEAQAAGPSPALQGIVMRAIDTPAAPTPARRFNFAWLHSKGFAGSGLLAMVALAAIFILHPTTQRAGEVTAPIVAPAVQDEMSAARTKSPAGMAAASSAHFGEDVPKVPAPAPAPASADRAGKTQRSLARTGEIDLLVPDVPAALNRIQTLADTQFGAITGLQDDAPSAPGGTHTAKVTVSVPDDRFTHTLEALAGMGGVVSRSVTTEDLTDSIVDGDARLRNLRHEETDLLRIMDRSGKVEDILSVEEQLASTREAIEQLDAEQKAMRQRVSYATITVDLSDEKTTPVAVPGAGAQLSDAWQGALHSVAACTLLLASMGLYLVAFAPYLIAIALLGYVAYRRIAGRR
jgi:hypothetical protein